MKTPAHISSYHVALSSQRLNTPRNALEIICYIEASVLHVDVKAIEKKFSIVIIFVNQTEKHVQNAQH